LEGKKRILRRGENRSVFINRENSFPYFIYVVARLKHVTQSTLSEHNIETGHQILFDKTITITNITSYFPRKYKEAIEIQKHSNNPNRDNGYNINKIWKTILLLVIEDQFPPPPSPSPTHNSLLSPQHSNK